MSWASLHCISEQSELGTKNQTRYAEVEMMGEGVDEVDETASSWDRVEEACFAVPSVDCFTVASKLASRHGCRDKMLGLQALICGEIQISCEALAAPISGCLDLEDFTTNLVEECRTASAK